MWDILTSVSPFLHRNLTQLRAMSSAIAHFAILQETTSQYALTLCHAVFPVLRLPALPCPALRPPASASVRLRLNVRQAWFFCVYVVPTSRGLPKGLLSVLPTRRTTYPQTWFINPENRGWKPVPRCPVAPRIQKQVTYQGSTNVSKHVAATSKF